MENKRTDRNFELILSLVRPIKLLKIPLFFAQDLTRKILSQTLDSKKGNSAARYMEWKVSEIEPRDVMRD